MATRCFVIGPIGDRFAPIGSDGRETFEQAIEVMEKVIVPACEANDLDAIRSDQISVTGEITEQVFRHLRDDEVVIADLSGGNANVMYELGLRHTTGKLTVHIGEFGQLPFDVNTVRTIRFSRSERGLIDARKELTRALQAGLLDGGDPITASRLWQAVDAEQRNAEAVAAAGPGEALEDVEPGFLESLAQMESSMPALVDIAGQITEVIEELGAGAEGAGAELDQANARSAGASARLAIVNRFAKTLTELSARLEAHTDEFEREVGVLDAGMGAIIGVLKTQPELLEKDDTQSFIESIAGLAGSAREGMEGLNGFGSSAEGLGALSKSLRVPGRRIGKSVQTMARAASLIDEWERQLVPFAKKS